MTVDSDMPVEPISDVEAGFRKVLDSHGFGFQSAVLRRAAQLHSGSKSTWIFEASEFPVRVAVGSTRIDFVLKQSPRRAYLIAECKRVDPALSNWCFARAPLHGGNLPINEPYMVECVKHFHGDVIAEGFPLTHYDAYHIAIEIRSHDKGNSSGRTFDEAITQVLKGTNGFVNFLASKIALAPEGTTSLLLPVVFTTAALWVSDAALNNADLNSGKVDFTGSTLKRVSWLVYQHFQSPEIAHDLGGTQNQDSIRRILETDYIRSVAIVAPEGIEDFLRWSAIFVT